MEGAEGLAEIELDWPAFHLEGSLFETINWHREVLLKDCTKWDTRGE